MYYNKRVSNRITQISFDASPLENMKLLLLELLPSTDEKMAEMEVWYAFTAKSKTDPVLKEHADKVYDELRHAMAKVITYLMELNLCRTDIDKELEIERLYALVDGLGIHAILRPDQMNTKIMENILTTHLATLCRDAK